MEQQERSRAYSIIVSILLLLAAAFGWFFWQKSQDYLAEKKQKEVTIDSLIGVKQALEVELDTLTLSFNGLQAENENLQGRLAEVAAKVRAKEAIIRNLKSQNVRDADALRNQISELGNVRAEYEATIRLLREENSQLKNENLALKTENQGLKGDITNLNDKVSDLAKKLEDQIRSTQSAKFRASSFKVELSKRRDRLTVKARRASDIAVSFDLADVPSIYQGANKLYLAITDENGKPIASDSPTKITIDAPSQKVDIVAQQTKAVVLQETQRFSFNYKLDERLKSGNYVVAIYCDKGLLGVSSFRLR